jgi:hypothetical protein
MRPVLLEPDGELTAQLVTDVLGLVSVTVPPAAAEPWTRMERLLAYDWAIREHLRASDNPVPRRDKPSFVTAAQT